MLSRERLWRRVSGELGWPLTWALGAACALPWMVSERWDGNLALPWLVCGWLAVLASLPLIRFRRWAVLPVSLLLVWVTFLGLRQRALQESSLPTGLLEIRGTVSAPWSLQGERRQGRIRIAWPESLRGMNLPLSLPAEGEAAPLPGTPVRFRGELRRVEPAPVFLVERPLWRARSDEAPRRIYLRSALLLEPLGPPAPSWLLRLQLFMRARFEKLELPAGTARDLWGALTLGIPPARDEVFSAFAESGTIHTLVVSGLQVTLVMVALESLWRRLFRRGSGVAACFAGLLYALMVGFSAPVWRGLLMGFAWALGRSSGWRLPPVLTLHGALVVWLLGHPAAGCEPGFLLAWFALLGLLWSAEPLAGLFTPFLGARALILARFLAPWLTTLPLLALFHGGAPLWGVAANMLVLPMVAFLTPLCLFLTLCPVPGLVPAAGVLLAWIGDRIVPFFSRIAPLGTGILWPWMALALGWILLAHGYALMKRTRTLASLLLVGSLAMLAAGGTGRAPKSLSLEAVDIGQGDALLLRVPGGDATLVDTGLSPWSARRLARMLSRRGVREPIHLVVTHPHGDHAGGWSTLSRLRPMASVSLPDLADAGAWNPFAAPMAVRSAVKLLRGDSWRRGEAAFSVRWPPKPFALPDPNLVSLVLRVGWRDREIWLMGDATDIQERDLMDLGDPEPTRARRLLKAGHHGGSNASDPSWIQRLRPEWALFTAGRHNAFGHPDGRTLETMGKAGVRIIGDTGTHYGLRLAAMEGGWMVETGRGERSLF